MLYILCSSHWLSLALFVIFLNFLLNFVLALFCRWWCCPHSSKDRWCAEKIQWAPVTVGWFSWTNGGGTSYSQEFSGSTYWLLKLDNCHRTRTPYLGIRCPKQHGKHWGELQNTCIMNINGICGAVRHGG